MINNHDIQTAWITKLQSESAVTLRIDPDEIREDNWKGQKFTYPNIRVKMGLLTPQTDASNCQIFHSLVSILVFSAEKSSKEADSIAGIIATAFWGKAYSSEGVKFVKVSLESLAPADVPENNEDVWVATVNFNALVHNA